MLIYLVSSAILAILFYRLSSRLYTEEVSMPDEDPKKPLENKEETKPKLTKEEKEKRELLRKEKTPAAMLFRAQTALSSYFDDANTEEMVLTTIIQGLDEDSQVDLKVIAETSKGKIAFYYASACKEKESLMFFTKEEARELLNLLSRATGR